VIGVAVSALRRKLDGDAALVETVRGVGYRWRET
jgi:DNA-binding response OmpR family regulator